MDDENRLVYLPWDSEHFMLPIGRIKARGLEGERLREILNEATQKGIGLLETFCCIEDETSVLTLEEHGFRYAGVKIYASRSVASNHVPTLGVEQSFGRAVEADIPELQSIFGDLYEDSRYNNYRCLDPKHIQKLYKIWITKAVYGQFDDLCLVLRVGQDPVALCTLRLNDHSARIGLFGVARRYHRRGLGLVLMEHVVTWLRLRSIPVVITATQGRNIAAIRFYERSGFLVDTLEMCFYKRIIQ